ncbi:MAG: molybdenum cofactor biosynthesis protein MoaB [Calditrichaeota bacterium]|nr:MAG: molybdenum cofactor biosynthesis protein MoaB [Calditrichota bacterium]
MTESASHQHKKMATEKGAIEVAIITVSDTRTPETDVNGRFLQQEIENAGHKVAAYFIVKDEPAEVEAALDSQDTKSAQIVLLNGGTGISSRDRTFDVVERRLQKVLPGFGEIFRMLSWEQVGASAILSRAVAGVAHGQFIVSTPGSPAAVKLAWEKLIKSEMQHFAWELTR